MITADFAKTQILRLSQLKRFPTEVLALKELVRALEGAFNEGIAVQIIDYVVRTQFECPPPSAFYGSVREANERIVRREDPLEGLVREVLCPECNGLGAAGKAPNMVFCDCKDGHDVRTHPELGLRYLRLANKLGIKSLNTFPGRNMNDHSEVLR